MEPDALLALSVKLSTLFAVGGAGNSFLALQYPALPLDLGDPAGPQVTDQEAARGAADLARVLNLVPAPQPRFSSDMRLLWNVHDGVLRDAVVAEDRSGDAERAARERARSVLYVQPTPDAPLEPSPRLRAYDTHRIRHTDAQLALDSLLMSIRYAGSTQEADRLRLQQAMLEQAVQQALDDWHGMGFKREVDQAKAVLSNSDGAGNLLAWRDWRDDFRRARRTDLDDGEYYQTRLFPDSVAEANWTRVSVHAGEVAALTAEGAGVAGLRDVAADAPTLDVELLSVEVARVEIVRPWWDPAVLRSRFWRWRDAGRPPLSDGADPPTGDLAAYLTGLVLARDLTLSLTPGSRRNDAILESLGPDRSFRFGPVELAAQGRGALRSVTAGSVRAHELGAYLSSPAAASGAARPRAAAPGVVPVFAEDALRDHAAGGRRPTVVATAGLRAARVPEGPPIVVRPPAETDDPPPRPRPWWKDGPPKGPGGVRPPRPGTPGPPTPPGVQVIGFVCAKVPRSPDPDSELQWDPDLDRT